MTDRHLHLLTKRVLLSRLLLLLFCNALASAEIDGYHKCENGCYDINSDCVCDQRCDTNDPNYQSHLGCSFTLTADRVFIVLGNYYTDGVYLPSSIRLQDTEVYLNEAKERFMHRTRYGGWLISNYNQLHSFLGGRGGVGSDPELNKRTIASESVVGFKVRLAFSPLGAPFTDDNHLAGDYFISASYIINGRGVYEHQALDRFVAFNGARWVITDRANLNQVSAGASFSGFASSDELSGTYQASSGSSFFWVSLAADETCDAAPAGERTVMRCINRCTPSFAGLPTASICAAEAGNCHRTHGGISCGACGAGYQGNGYHCTDVDECSSGTHTCDAIRATCRNQIGSFTCSCNDGYVGTGSTCSDIDECAVGTETRTVRVNSTLDNPGGAIDGVVHNGDSNSWQQVGAFGDAKQCNASQYVVLDLGEAKKVSGVSFWNYYDDQRQYCGQSVELSRTGAFKGEQVQVFGCGTFDECGYSSATGRVLVFEPSIARYVRVGSSRNNRNTGIHILDVVVRTISVCSLEESCMNIDGGFKCLLPVTKQQLRDYVNSFDEDSSCLDLDTSQITDMSSLFSSASAAFDCDISGWDVSRVTNMAEMFQNFDMPNLDLSGWDTSSVTNMNSMFRNAGSFNTNIAGWDVSSVTNMYRMFQHCGSFNQDLSSWNTSSVTNMNGMFHNAGKFNANISGWDVSRVTIMANMFRNAALFSQDISLWNVGSVTGMSRAFFNAASFTQDLSRWTDLLPESIVQNQAIIFGGSCPKNAFAGGSSSGQRALVAESAEASSQTGVLSDSAVDDQGVPFHAGITTPWVAASASIAGASFIVALFLLARRLRARGTEEGGGVSRSAVKAEVAFEVALGESSVRRRSEAAQGRRALADADVV